jgi:hypothetical protein
MAIDENFASVRIQDAMTRIYLGPEGVIIIDRKTADRCCILNNSIKISVPDKDAKALTAAIGRMERASWR